MSARAVVLGYASADRAVRVDALPAPDTTAIVRERLSRPWPRPGGCGPVIAHGLAVAGVATACLTWLGSDAPGTALREWLREAGVMLDGVAMSAVRTPEALLVYDADGRCACFYDPGDTPADGLDAAQRELVAAAELLCLSVGPAAATRDSLDVVAPGALVAWSVKADATAYDPDLVRRLLARADVIALSAGELAFLERQAPGVAPRPDALVVQTRGAQGARWSRGGQSGNVAARPLDVPDPTGAGDAFVAGLLAVLLDTPDDVRAAVQRAMTTSAALLACRAPKETLA